MSFFSDLAEAATIFDKYATQYAGTHCEHDIITVHGVDPVAVDAADIERLESLGFSPHEEYGEYCFASWRYGSC